MIIPLRRRRRMAVVVAVLLSAGCSAPTSGQGAPSSSEASSSTGARPLALGAEGSVDATPWAQVGPGWKLATWRPAANPSSGPAPAPGAPSYETVPTTLFLVNPAGGRYSITTFPPPGADGISPELVDWSGDGRRALFSDPADTGKVVEVDLHTGAQHAIAVDGTARYTRPNGRALLVTKREGNEPSVLERVDLAGRPQLTYPVELQESRSRYLSTPDGTQLVLAAATGLIVMSNDGKTSRTVQVAGQTDCSPLRWWDGTAGTTVLAMCSRGDAVYGSRLWEVPIDGGTPTALTAPIDGQESGADTGLNAWRLPAGTFLQAHSGGCGFVFLAKLAADGTMTQVTVPDLDPTHSVVVVGVSGDNLDLVGNVAGCGSAESLVEYDPAKGTTTVLLGPPLNGGAVIEALPYPRQD